MSERIDQIQYTKESPGTTLFLDGPTEFLVASVVDQIKIIPQWKSIFGQFIDGYRRMDYPERSLPAMRVYNELYTKTFDSWFIEGDLKCDVIWPASIRRPETQQLPDTISAALLQQFRATPLFNAVSGLVPGLNELGKTFGVDKSLGFEWNDKVVPLTQITVNFRLDLRQWDLYLEASLRTKDDPFEETLGNLNRIAGTIQALREDLETELNVPFDQRL
jgi:hypothetical protein